MNRQTLVDNQTRIGIGAGVAIALAIYFAPDLGMAARPVLFICVVILIWGLWPLAQPFLQTASKYLNGPGRTHAVAAGVLLLGIGIGGSVSTGQHAFWALAPNTGKIVWNFEQTASGHGYFLNLQKPPNEEIRVIGFGAHGRNNSADPINDFSGYIR